VPSSTSSVLGTGVVMKSLASVLDTHEVYPAGSETILI
jgi:hypothetical protein